MCREEAQSGCQAARDRGTILAQTFVQIHHYSLPHQMTLEVLCFVSIGRAPTSGRKHTGKPGGVSNVLDATNFRWAMVPTTDALCQEMTEVHAERGIQSGFVNARTREETSSGKF